MPSPVTRESQRARRTAQIIDAAITVMARDGVEALSHRLIAEVAGVPLGATTYYFASLEDIRLAALGHIVRRDLAAMEEALTELPPTADLAEVLGRLLYEMLQDREASVLAVELFASALRRDGVRELALMWERAWIDALEARVGRVPALASLFATFGYVNHALLHEDPLSQAEMTEVLRQTL